MPVIKNNIILWHLLAAVIVGVWGTTFVNTKVLYNSGLTPLEIFFLRFLIAYICIWFISPRRLFSRTWHDELIMLLLGVMGGSVFFLAENYAVGLTYVNNVSFIVCTAPLMTVILGIAFVRSIKARWPLIIGSLVALVGVAIVIFNGSLVLHLNPWGDLLALLASVCWAVYSLLMRKVSHAYSAVFITRKIFFYGLVTVLPAFFFDPWTAAPSMLLMPKVVLNLLFLGLVASFPLLCPVDIGHWKNRCHDLFELSVPQSCHHRCCKCCLSQRAHDCHCVCRKCVDTCGCSGGE